MPNDTGLPATSMVSDEVLQGMLAEIKSAGGLFLPSPFWDDLAKKHISELELYGFENFKRTLSLKYFTWGMKGLIAQQSWPTLKAWIRDPSSDIFCAHVLKNAEGKQPEPFNFWQRKIYAFFVAAMAKEVIKNDSLGLVDKVGDPKLGNPLYVALKDGRNVTQDLINSVYEYYCITENGARGEGAQETILEIGAGYGRLAPIFLTARPNTKYWIVDIPPALYVSQKYLEALYGNHKIFKFRHFDRYDDVQDEVENSDICFFTPNQITMLPGKKVDFVICISNLHEMTREQIDFYYNQIDRICRGIFYTKQWMKSIALSNGFSIAHGEYPIKPNWRTVYDRRHHHQTWFFESLHDLS